jgi:tungsten cofactor oxidoreducase radical SAM maturase
VDKVTFPFRNYDTMKTLKELDMLENRPVRKVYLELTQRCNLNCISCFRRNWEGELGEMSMETLLNCIDHFTGLEALEEIVLGGIGEPTIHSRFNEIIGLLPDVTLSITTNAFDWSDETIDTLARNFERVIVSVDGLHGTFHDIRNFPLDKLFDNVGKLIRKRTELGLIRPFLIAQLVLSDYNIDEVDRLIPLLHKHGFMKLILSNLLPQCQEDAGRIVYTLLENENLKQKRNDWLNLTMQNQMQIKFPNIQLKTERKCVFVEDGTLTVNSDGNVSSCYRFAHPSVEYVFGRRKQVYPFHYGNVNQTSLSKIWDSQRYRDLRLQNLANRFPSCPDCDLVDSCDYVNDSQCDCKGQNPSCADCLWTRGFVECA